MLQVTRFLSIPCNELTVKYIHSSGPGGQNVNKVSSAVQLRFNIFASPSLSQDIKARLEKVAGNKMTVAGDIVIEAKRYRLRDRNQTDAEQRLIALIRKAIPEPKKRRLTHPTLSSQSRRIQTKKTRGKIKTLRKSIDE
jgi:ribosome-associated protein